MKPVHRHSTTLTEFSCRIEVLMETPDAVSAEHGYYPRQSSCRPVQLPAPAPFFRDKDEELALRIDAFRESPYLPDISWMC